MTKGRKKGSGVKDKKVKDALSQLSVFTLNDVQSLVPDVSYGYIHVFIKKADNITPVGKDGRTIIYRNTDNADKTVLVKAAVNKSKRVNPNRTVKIGMTSPAAFETAMQKKTIVEIGRKNMEQFIAVWDGFFHRISTSEYVYWNSEKQVMVKTDISVYSASKVILSEWKKKYLESMDRAA